MITQRSLFILIGWRTLSLSESIMETCSVVLTFESVDEILWCDHSNETSFAVLLRVTIHFSIFYKMKFGIFSSILIFGTLRRLRDNESKRPRRKSLLITTGNMYTAFRN